MQAKCVFRKQEFYILCCRIRVQEGLLSLEEKLTEAFKEELPKDVNCYLEKACVRDLLTMCLGQDRSHFMGGQRPLYEEDDWAKLALSIPFVCEPGTKFVYSNVGILRSFLMRLWMNYIRSCKDIRKFAFSLADSIL